MCAERECWKLRARVDFNAACRFVVAAASNFGWRLHGDAVAIDAGGFKRGTNGFGYDPAFVPEGHTRTSGELTPAEKDAISHRGRALRAMIPELVKVLGLEVS